MVLTLCIIIFFLQQLFLEEHWIFLLMSTSVKFITMTYDIQVFFYDFSNGFVCAISQIHDLFSSCWVLGCVQNVDENVHVQFCLSWSKQSQICYTKVLLLSGMYCIQVFIYSTCAIRKLYIFYCLLCCREQM